MASPFRNHPVHANPRYALDVTPLNAIPYVGPPTPPGDIGSTQSGQETEAAEFVGPAMIFFPSRPTQREWDNILSVSKTAVALTGVAALGKIGRPVGAVDIAETDDSFIFRVTLPGTARDLSSFSCDVRPDGKVRIEGVTTTTGEETVFSHAFTDGTLNLCPPEDFSISFNLAGPVDTEDVINNFRREGILEGIVKKRGA